MDNVEQIFDKVEGYVPESQKKNFEGVKTQLEGKAAESFVKNAFSGDKKEGSNGGSNAILEQGVKMAENYLSKQGGDNKDGNSQNQALEQGLKMAENYLSKN